MDHPPNTIHLPSGEILATTILASFGSALHRFDEFWHAGWFAPANERACVAKVAVDLTKEFGQTLEPWCEVSLGTLCGWKGKEVPMEIDKRGPVDLVLCDTMKGDIVALIEFKTHESLADENKLTLLQKHIVIPTVIIVACHGVRLLVDKNRAVSRLDEYIQISLKQPPAGWLAIVDPNRPHIDIKARDGSKWLVRPFVVWQSE